MDFLEKNIDIKDLSNFKTPAIAKFYYEIKSESDLDRLHEIYKFAESEKLKVLLISGGTNMLLAFDEFEGIVIKNSLVGWTYISESKHLEAYSNESIRQIAEDLEKKYSNSLWHRFIGLPGSIGGAVFGNAGCFGLETENNFLEAHVLDISTGKSHILQKNEMNFSYRNSYLKENEGKYFLIKAKFDLSKKIEKYHSDVDNIDFRENKQPNGKSCGSFFKNPSKEHSAGYLIENVGLKGYSYGGALYSDKHANFLMNDGSATRKDLLYLIELAQERVKEQFGIDLMNEVRIITN